MFHPIPLFLGLRYTRAKRRNHFISFISLVSMLGIMLGIVALIVVLSVMNGFHKEIRERILSMASHATLADPYGGGMKDWREALTKVRGLPEVVGAAPFVEVQAMLVGPSNVSGALVRGILPKEEDQVAELRRDMDSGSVDDLESGTFRIILGRDLAMYLGVGKGDKVTVVTPQVSATPVGIMPRLKRFTVSGIFSVGMADYDRNAAFIQMEDAAKLMTLGDGVTGIRVKLSDLWEAPRLSREIAYQLGGVYLVRDWTQVHANFFRALAVEKRMMSMILFLIVAVAAFNIVSALVMVVTDKQSDIAVLRTLGASPSSVMGIFVVQGTAIGLRRYPDRGGGGGAAGAQPGARGGRHRVPLRGPFPGPEHLLHQRAALRRAPGGRGDHCHLGLRDVGGCHPLPGLARVHHPARGGPAL